jgi:hypothetical protein
MASSERDVPVRLHVFGLPHTPGVARVRERDPGERARRALQAAAIGVGLAAVSVLLPIAHVVLVPGFLIATPFFVVRRLRERASVVALSGECPRCHAMPAYEVQGALRAGLKTSCPACSFAIDVEPGDS